MSLQTRLGRAPRLPLRLRLRPPRWRPALTMAVPLLTAATIVFAIRHHRLPAPTGPYPVGTFVRSFTDAGRHEELSPDPAARREVVVQVWYPAERSSRPIAWYRRLREATPATLAETLVPTDARWQAPPRLAGGPWPLLLYGPRWGGQRTQNTALAEDLASHGYVVVAVDHPYNAPRVLLEDGRILAGDQDMNGPRGDQATAAERIAFWNRTLPVWVADERFALDRVLVLAADRAGGTPLAGMIDPNRIGAFGHSFGGAAALALLGVDARVRAGVNLDGWSFAGLDHRTAAQPIMVLYEQSVQALRDSFVQHPPAGGDVDSQMEFVDMGDVQRSLERDGGWRLYVHGAQHLDFSDQPLLLPLHRGGFTGPIAPLEIERLDREVLRAFFDGALSGHASPLLADAKALQAAFPEVQAVEYPSPPHVR